MLKWMYAVKIMGIVWNKDWVGTYRGRVWMSYQRDGWKKTKCGGDANVEMDICSENNGLVWNKEWVPTEAVTEKLRSGTDMLWGEDERKVWMVIGLDEGQRKNGRIDDMNKKGVSPEITADRKEWKKHVPTSRNVRQGQEDNDVL